jgi:hypothetical protein
MSLMRKIPLQTGFVQIPNETARRVEKDMSLQAFGLLGNLWAYNTDKWVLHKTELYKRFGKNKETSVRNAWKELMERGYIMEFKLRVGKKWQYE